MQDFWGEQGKFGKRKVVDIRQQPITEKNHKQKEIAN